VRLWPPATLLWGLSYRDVEEFLAERGVEVDHVTVYRWVLRFTPLLDEAARPCRHASNATTGGWPGHLAPAGLLASPGS
jgi:transposase-like protein